MKWTHKWYLSLSGTAGGCIWQHTGNWCEGKATGENSSWGTYREIHNQKLHSSIPGHAVNICLFYYFCSIIGVCVSSQHELLSLWSLTSSRDWLWQWRWEYAPLLPSSVIICDRLYGQPRLVTQPHTGLLRIIWLICILYNALLPAAVVNSGTVTQSLSGVNHRRATECVNVLSFTLRSWKWPMWPMCK